MRGLVSGEVSRLETLRQHHGLTEGKAEAFAGDGIDSAGSIADQRDITPPDTLQFAIGGHRSSLSRYRLSSPKACSEIGERRQRLLQAKPGVVRSHGHTDLFATYGCSIALNVSPPIY